VSTSANAAASRHVGALPPEPPLPLVLEAAVDPPEPSVLETVSSLEPPAPPAPPELLVPLVVLGSTPVVTLDVVGDGEIGSPPQPAAVTAALPSPVIIIAARARALFLLICNIVVVSIEALARASRFEAEPALRQGATSKGWMMKMKRQQDGRVAQPSPPSTPEVADGLDAAGLLAPGSSSGGPSRTSLDARAPGSIQW